MTFKNINTKWKMIRKMRDRDIIKYGWIHRRGRIQLVKIY